ncbi:hypothetical protein ACJRO7_034122 [Eucalyptus globulus]|uniref:Uncharacterized protein n=1 Tax=Eucalyptus globulus TaxID=34317 RepID=A0ABD3J276_EUCGL
MDVPPITQYGAIVSLDVYLHDVYDPDIDMVFSKYEATLWLDDGRAKLIPMMFVAWFINHEGEMFGPLPFGAGGLGVGMDGA